MAAAAEELAVCHVTIGGLPNAILPAPMLQAVLQQAGLEGEVLGFSAEEGEPCGQVRVALASYPAAVRCVRHFEGCRWDPSGAEVTTRTEPSLEEMADQMWDEAAMLELKATMVAQEAATDAAPEAELAGAPVHLRAEAPAFKPDALAEIAEAEFAGTGVHLRAEAPAFEPHPLAEIAEETTPRLQLSADAPAFVPNVAAAPPGTSSGAKLGISSDTSTEIGDSDGEYSPVPKTDA